MIQSKSIYLYLLTKWICCIEIQPFKNNSVFHIIEMLEFNVFFNFITEFDESG